MALSDEQLLTEQHRIIEEGIVGLVDGSGSRKELTKAIYLLRKHIYVEEEVLFPIVAEDGKREMALAQMKYEHGDMWPHLELAIELLERNAPLDDLFKPANALMELLHIHDAKEEEAIYTIAHRYAAQATNPPLASLFKTYDIPAGWKCLRAPDNDMP